MSATSRPADSVSEGDSPSASRRVPALRHADRHQQVQPGLRLAEMGQGGWQRVPVLDARLGDLPGESLGDFGGFDDAAPLCHQAWNVGARGEESASGQSFDVESNRRFVHGACFARIRGASYKMVRLTTLGILPPTGSCCHNAAGIPAAPNVELCLTPA